MSKISSLALGSSVSGNPRVCLLPQTLKLSESSARDFIFSLPLSHYLDQKRQLLVYFWYQTEAWFFCHIIRENLRVANITLHWERYTQQRCSR